MDNPSTLPNTPSGIGIRSAHIQEVIDNQPNIGFLEAHSENYFGHSQARDKLIQLSTHYPISLHSVGISLGRFDQLDKQHLDQLKSLVEDVKPIYLSEHLAWSAFGHRHVPDLLPLPLTNKSFAIVCDHIKQMQDTLQHQIYIENPSNYAVFDASTIDETNFLNELATETGCGLLIDINNIYISAFNINKSPKEYINQINSTHIKQYHLAGHLKTNIKGTDILIDSHDQIVDDKVWTLYQYALNTKGARPTIIEWDSDLPELQVLIDHANHAQHLINTTNLTTNNNSEKHLGLTITASDNGVNKFQDKFLNSIFNMQPINDEFIESHQQRIKVYQTNCFSALKQYLDSVYPATINALGETFYRQFIHQYISQHQPEQGNLHQYGRSLVTFAKEYSLLKDYPFIPYLIKLEWAIHSAYYADNQSITDFEDPNIVTQKMILNESVTLLNSDYPIRQLWEQSLPNFEGTFDVSMVDGYNEVIIVFKADSVKVDYLNHAEYQLSSLLKKPIFLQDCIEQLSEVLSNEDITQALGSIMQRQIITLAENTTIN